MALYDQPNLTSGLDDALISTARSVPAFPIMILVFTYLFVLIGGSSNQKRRTGTADYPFWSLLAGLTLVFEGLVMTLGSVGIIQPYVLSIVFGITILSAVWFFLSKQRGEQ